MKFGFRASFVAVLLAGVVLGGVGSSAEVEAGRLSVRVGGVCVREGARNKVAGKRVVCVSNAKKQLRWRFVKAKTVRVVTATTTSTSVAPKTTVAPTTTVTNTTTTTTTVPRTTTTTTSSTVPTTTSTVPVTTTSVVVRVSGGFAGYLGSKCWDGSDRPYFFGSDLVARAGGCPTVPTTTAAPATVPGAPTIGAVAVASATSVTVNCTTPASNGGATITTYTATAVGDATKTGTLTSATCGLITVTGLTTNTAYTFTVTATNAAGTSAASAASAAVTPVLTCAVGGACIVGNTGPGGGIVFYVHATGTFACGATLASTCKYLEVAPSGWNTGADPTKLWAVVAHESSDIATIANDATPYNNALGIGLGYKNSLAIVNQGNDTTTAAGAARAYGGGSKSDWYLPTTAELNLLCQWARNVGQSVTTRCTGGTLNTGTGASGGFSADDYWSSSEFDGKIAWIQVFDDGQRTSNLFKNGSHAVRPVRAFG